MRKIWLILFSICTCIYIYAFAIGKIHSSLEKQGPHTSGTVNTFLTNLRNFVNSTQSVSDDGGDDEDSGDAENGGGDLTPAQALQNNINQTGKDYLGNTVTTTENSDGSVSYNVEWVNGTGIQTLTADQYNSYLDLQAQAFSSDGTTWNMNNFTVQYLAGTGNPGIVAGYTYSETEGGVNLSIIVDSNQGNAQETLSVPATTPTPPPPCDDCGDMGGGGGGGDMGGGGDDPNTIDPNTTDPNTTDPNTDPGTPIISCSLSVSEDQSQRINPATATSNDGQIAVTVTGGSGTYSYTINPPGGTNSPGSGTFSNLGPGNYTITVTDDNGCTGQVSIKLCAPITVSGTVTSPSIGAKTGGVDATGAAIYNGTIQSDGVITASASGSSGFRYTCTGGTQTTPGTFTNLSPNGTDGVTYYITVTDANGCASQPIPFVVQAKMPIQNPCITASLNSTIGVFNSTTGGFDSFKDNGAGGISSLISSAYNGPNGINFTIFQVNFGDPNEDGVTTKTNSGTEPAYIQIMLSNQLATSSQEFVAASILHEMLHAYLFYTGVPAITQHSVMSTTYFNTFINSLQTLFPSPTGLSTNDAIALALGGLQGTDVYDNWDSNHPGGPSLAYLQTTNINYKKGISGTRTACH